MTNETTILIQAEVDGQNTPEASSKLAEICRENPAVRSELDAALSVGKALDSLSDAQLPDGFMARVMDALPDEPSWAKNRRPVADRSPVRAVRSTSIFSRRPILNLAYGLVVGVFVTFAAMSTLQTDSVPMDGVSGTMMTSDDTPIFEDSVVIDDEHTVQVTVWEDESGLSTRIEGAMPEGAASSIVVNLPGGRQVVIPFDTP